MVILAHRLFHLIRRREHAGPAPTFEHPVLREDHSDEPQQDADAVREYDGGTPPAQGSGSSGRGTGA
jgi:undecaprenyl-diphosphatase